MITLSKDLLVNRFIRISTFMMMLFSLVMVSRGARSSQLAVIDKKSLSGDQGWDYLTFDSAARRLYISRGDHVAVIDADTLNSITDIKETDGVHGIALARPLKKGFTSNGKSSTVTVFDLETSNPLLVVKTGERPDAIVFEPKTQQVLSFNGGSHDSTIIDAKSGKVLARFHSAESPSSRWQMVTA